MTFSLRYTASRPILILIYSSDCLDIFVTCIVNELLWCKVMVYFLSSLMDFFLLNQAKILIEVFSA